MPRCSMFKHGITITTNGSIRPCCLFEKQYSKDYNYEWRYLDQTVWRRDFDNLYQKSLDDEWLPECVECKIEEEISGHSLRIEANRLFSDLPPALRYWDLKINNTCNLMCRMCSPNDSSIWKVKSLNNFQNDWDSTIIQSNKSNKKIGWHKELLPEVISELRYAEVIKFTGGEPMLIPQVKKILKWCVDEGISKNVILKITTNCTIDPDDEWIQLFKEFKETKINMSCDGIGKYYEYIRAGSNWENVEKNMLKIAKAQDNYKNIKSCVVFLPMSINAVCEKDLVAWCERNFIKFDRAPECRWPKYLSYATLSTELRKKYNITTTTEFKKDLLPELFKQMSLIDKLYNTNFEAMYPEFFNE